MFSAAFNSAANTSNDDSSMMLMRDDMIKNIKHIQQEDNKENTVVPTQPPKEWSYHAKRIFNMKLVCDPSDLSTPITTFHPEYSHVFFGDDERIEGYHKPEINMYFNAYTFDSYLSFTFAEKHKVLPATPVEQNIKMYLAPGSVTNNLDSFTEQVTVTKNSSNPFGSFVSEYSVTAKPDKTYQIFHHKFCSELGEVDDKFLKFHERMQFFVLLEIDGATYIDASDPRWEIYLLYEKTQNDTPSFHVIGYCTVYRFFSHPNTFRLRISQFLLFPPYQKCGHGRRLLQSIYDNAASRGARDVPVEDPAPEFSRLRDATDMMNLINDKAFDPAQKLITKEQIAEIVAKRKLWKAQIRRCFEIYRYHQVQKAEDPEEMKEYRIWVKKRLLLQNREHLELYEKGPERKQELHVLYETLIEQYRQIIEKLSLYTAF